MPAIIKILIVFFSMLALARLKLPMGLAILLGGLALNVWSGLAPCAVLANLGSAFAQPSLWLLLIITALVVEFGRAMARAENAGALLALSQRWGGRHGRLCSLMALPSIIGLIPMPAGALFSAPLVQQTVNEPHWAADWKAAINYWFRHVWEYWWPIYPVVIIGIAVFNMETWQFIAALIAFTPASLLAGYWFLLRPHQELLAAPLALPTGDSRRVLLIMIPLAVIIAAVLLLPPVVNLVAPGFDPQTRKLLAMVIGMLSGIGLIAFEERGRKSGLFRSLLSPHSANILLTIGSVAVFQFLLEKSGLVSQASRELLQSGIPVGPVVALLPLLAGIITGTASGFAGIAFPLVVGLLTAPDSSLTPMATLVLAFGFGYMGMILSPLHLCLLVTRDYFTAALLPIYRRCLPCVVFMLAFTLLIFGVFRALGW